MVRLTLFISESYAVVAEICISITDLIVIVIALALYCTVHCFRQCTPSLLATNADKILISFTLLLYYVRVRFATAKFFFFFFFHSSSSSSSSYWRNLELPHPPSVALALLFFLCFFVARRDTATSMEFTISNASSKISMTLLLLSLVVGE